MCQYYCRLYIHLCGQSAFEWLKSHCVKSRLYMIVKYLTTRAVVTLENSGRYHIPVVIASMDLTAITRYPGKREINDRSTSYTTHNLHRNAPFDYDGIITGKTEHFPCPIVSSHETPVIIISARRIITGRNDDHQIDN